MWTLIFSATLMICCSGILAVWLLSGTPPLVQVRVIVVLPGYDRPAGRQSRCPDRTLLGACYGV